MRMLKVHFTRNIYTFLHENAMKSHLQFRCLSMCINYQNEMQFCSCSETSPVYCILDYSILTGHSINETKKMKGTT